jgi:hypothetical protein
VHRIVAAVVSALLCAFPAGCGTSGDGSSPDRDGDGASGREPAPGLEATLRRSRLFETRRQIGLELAATGDADVRVGTIQLVTPLYETVAPTDRGTTLEAGARALLMPIPFGTARCDGAAGGSAELVAVVDGEEVRVSLTERPDGMLAHLQGIECASAAVLEDLALELSGLWVLTDPQTTTGQLTVAQRRPGVTATVDEVLGNVIFGLTTTTTGPVLTIGDDKPTATVGVTISSSRCDPHALTEYKRTFIFAVEVRLDGAEPVRVDVEAQGDARAALAELLRSCVG